MTKTKTKNLKNESDEKTIKKVLKFKKPVQNIEDLELKEGMEVVLEKYTFRKVVRNIKNGKIIVDSDFQRDEVYRIPQKSGIINSAMLGKCIPPLYAFEDRGVDGKYVLSIIDGQQRLSSVRDFMNNKYALKIPYGELSILNGYTYKQIKEINEDLAEQIGDLTLDINVIRNITKEEAQEYFGLINTTSVPLSPGEQCRSIHEPVRPVLDEIINNPYFKITNLRKTRKREYVLATKLLWNQMFVDPLKHEFVGDTIKTFIDYFNQLEDLEFLERSKKGVLDLLKTFSKITEKCQYSPRTQGDLYATLCFLSTLEKKNQVDVNKLSKFFNWIFKGINKQIYPITLKDQFEQLLGNRVSVGRHVNSREFVILLESLYKEEEGIWMK